MPMDDDPMDDEPMDDMDDEDMGEDAEVTLDEEDVQALKSALEAAQSVMDKLAGGLGDDEPMDDMMMRTWVIWTWTSLKWMTLLEEMR